MWTSKEAMVGTQRLQLGPMKITEQTHILRENRGCLQAQAPPSSLLLPAPWPTPPPIWGGSLGVRNETIP